GCNVPAAETLQGSAFPTVGTEPLFAGIGDGGNGSDARNGFAYYKAGIGGVFPDRQPRTGRAPGRHDLRIRPRLARDPFDEVKHQRIGGLIHVHRNLPLRSCLASTRSTPFRLRKLRARASPLSSAPRSGSGSAPWRETRWSIFR